MNSDTKNRGILTRLYLGGDHQDSEALKILSHKEKLKKLWLFNYWRDFWGLWHMSLVFEELSKGNRLNYYSLLFQSADQGLTQKWQEGNRCIYWLWPACPVLG